MEINRNAPATAEGELRIDADPQTVFSVISAIGQWPSWNPDVKSVSAESAASTPAQSTRSSPASSRFSGGAHAGAL